MQKDYVKTRMRINDENTINDILKNIEECFRPKNKHLMTCYRLNPNEQSNDVDVAILNGLLKAYDTRIPAHLKGKEFKTQLNVVRKNIKTQLNLCMAWNRYDIAKNFIFRDDFQEIVSAFFSHSVICKYIKSTKNK